MNSEAAITLAGVGKCYPTAGQPAARMWNLLWGRTATLGGFWALRGIDLTVRRGEALGIVGHNGAGKSTLLQIVAGTLAPSEGEVRVQGRIAALLELGAGFNPEFSGRENVFLTAAMHGLAREEIEERYPEIVAFSGVAAFIDQPVKTYSSGMLVRLAFSVAANVDPDVLIIDEALSVGDGEFARRSFDRIMHFREAGKTLLFCSHSLYQIEALCDRAMWIDHGQLRLLGAPAEVTMAYDTALAIKARVEMGEPEGGGSGPPIAAASPPPAAAAEVAPEASAEPASVVHVEVPIAPSPPPPAPGPTAAASSARISAVRLNGQTFESTRDDWAVEVEFASDPALPDPSVAVCIVTADGRTVTSTSTFLDGVVPRRDAAGRGRARLSIPLLPLLKGVYTVQAYVMCERGLHVYDYALDAARFTVRQPGLELGVVVVPHRWEG